MSHSIIETVIQHELERWAQLGPQCEITMSCGFPICRVGDRCLQSEVSQTNLVPPTLPIPRDEESTWQRFMHLLILFDPFFSSATEPYHTIFTYHRLCNYAACNCLYVSWCFAGLSATLHCAPRMSFIALGIEAHSFAWCPWRWRGRMGHSPRPTWAFPF